MLQEGCEAEAKLLCAYADLSAATEADSRADCEATGNGNQCAYSPKVCIVLRCAAMLCQCSCSAILRYSASAAFTVAASTVVDISSAIAASTTAAVPA